MKDYDDLRSIVWDDDVLNLLDECKWMRREIERVGRALFTNAEGHYTGTEEDLHAVGQFVEGCVETIEEQIQTIKELERKLALKFSE